MKKKRRFLSVATVLLGLTLLFQNCGETGGVSPFSSFASGGDCESTPALCAGDGKGDVKLLKLNITSGQAGQWLISKDGTEITAEGTCDKAGFRRTHVRWTLKNLTRTTAQLGGLSSECLESSFSLPMSLSGMTLSENDRLLLSASIVGLDNLDNSYPGTGNYSADTVELRVVDSILPPVLNTRAGCTDTVGDCGSNGWLPIPQKYYLYESSTDMIDVISPRIRGYCQIRTSPVDLTKQPASPLLDVALELHEAGLPPPMVVNPTGANVATVTKCKLLTAGMTKPGKYNGYFEFTSGFQLFTPATWPGSGGQTASNRHARLLVHMSDDIPNVGKSDLLSQEAIEMQFRYTGPNTGAGRGFTQPVAREALQLFKWAMEFDKTPVANPQTLASGYMASGLPFRRYVATNLMGVTETEDTAASKVNLTVEMNQNFPKKLHEIVLRTRACDMALNGNIPQLPDFDAGTGSISGTIGPADAIALKNKKALLRISVCLTYWHFYGALDRNDANSITYFKQMVTKGLTLGFIAGKLECPIFGQTEPSYDNGVCLGIQYFYGILTSQLARFSAPTPDLSKTSFTGTELDSAKKFYGAVAQMYLNHLMSGIACGQLEKNEQVSKVLSRGGISIMDPVERLKFAVKENNGFGSEPFAAYDKAKGCGSTDARGSLQ